MNELLPRVVLVLLFMVLVFGIAKYTGHPLARFNFNTGLVEK